MAGKHVSWERVTASRGKALQEALLLSTFRWTKIRGSSDRQKEEGRVVGKRAIMAKEIKVLTRATSRNCGAERRARAKRERTTSTTPPGAGKTLKPQQRGERGSLKFTPCVTSSKTGEN